MNKVHFITPDTVKYSISKREILFENKIKHLKGILI